jgi:hypothetical protein
MISSPLAIDLTADLCKLMRIVKIKNEYFQECGRIGSKRIFETSIVY